MKLTTFIGLCILSSFFIFPNAQSQTKTCIHIVNKSNIEVRLLIRSINVEDNKVSKIYYIEEFKPGLYRNIEVDPKQKLTLEAEVKGEEKIPVIIDKSCTFPATQTTSIQIKMTNHHYSLSCIADSKFNQPCV